MAEASRRVATIIARGRVGAGAALLVAAGPCATLIVGENHPAVRAAVRFTGGRDLALGAGTLTCLHEHAQDAEWVSMSALVDGIDAVVLLATPGLPLRARLIGLVAGGAAIVGLVTARRVADERAAAIAEDA